MKPTGATKNNSELDRIDKLLDIFRYADDVDRSANARVQIKRAMLTPDLRLRTALAEVRTIHTKKAKAYNHDDCGCDYCVVVRQFESGGKG